ncbi:hypothetical protein [Amycolatopsis sp. NPDC051903]|uniref:hypothetical protein n=1 Tax=Amycolatopsis sp. NPDC051903 TaxID=3363936 RepID=UPI0037872EE0
MASLVCLLGVLVVPPATALVVATAALALASLVWLCADGVRWVERLFGPNHAARRAATAVAMGLMVVGYFAATVTMVVGSVPAATTTAVLLFVTVWSGWRTLLKKPHRRDRRRRTTSAVPCSVPVSSLSLDELCLAWRRSFVQLQHARDERIRHLVVSARQDYLDELERRDRHGFAKWLDSGARAASDPSRFVHPIEWP